MSVQRFCCLSILQPIKMHAYVVPIPTKVVELALLRDDTCAESKVESRMHLICHASEINCLSSKIQLMRSLVTSIFLYACESWTLTAELQRRIHAMEMTCCRKILHLSYKDHVTNEEVRAKIQWATGPHEDLLTIVKRRKLHWYGHFSRSSDLA